MGLFDNEQESRSFLEMPAWMQGGPQAIQGQLMSLIGQDFLSPDQQVAGLNPAQLQGISNLTTFGADQASPIAAALRGAGMQGMGSMGMGQGFMQQALAGGPVQNMGPDMGRVAQIAADPYLDGQIAAALRDPARALTEQQLPGARLAAAASNNTNSTRRGVGEAILQRGFEDRAADVGAAMRGGAFGRGLGIEANRASQNAGLGANFQGLQGALGGQMFGQGMQQLGLLPQSLNTGMMGINAGLQGGNMLQAQDQRLADAGIRSFMFPYQQLQMLSPIQNQMAGTYGTQVNEQSSDPGLGNTLLGAGLGLAGTALMGGMNPFAGLGSMMGGLGNMFGSPAAGSSSWMDDMLSVPTPMNLSSFTNPFA